MAQPMLFHDRMSQSDSLMLDIERDPQLRSTITSVWMLDRTPDWQRFIHKLRRCVAEIPRLRQRAVSDGLGLAPPRWEFDAEFDLDYHVRRMAASNTTGDLSNEGGGASALRTLLDIAQPIGMQAFDMARPLWEFYWVDGLPGGRAGLIMKLHHAVSDGVGLVRMTENMIERSRESDGSENEPIAKLPAVETVTDGARIRDAARARVRADLDRSRVLAEAFGTGIGRLLREPREAARAWSDQAGSLGRLLAPVSEPMSPIMRRRSLSVHFDGLVVPLDDLKRAGKSVGGTLNDAFVGAVAGGLRQYHEQQGMPVEELRMNMPINMRSGGDAQDAGNQFAPVRFPVPVGIANPAARMRRIHELVAQQRAEPALQFMDGISAAIGSLPFGGASRITGAMIKAIDFTTSNVPGPRRSVYVSGARIEHMYGFGPLVGAAANVTCFSYDGDLAIGVNTDRAAITDPALFSECLRKGIDEVLSVV